MRFALAGIAQPGDGRGGLACDDDAAPADAAADDACEGAAVGSVGTDVRRVSETLGSGFGSTHAKAPAQASSENA